MELFDEFVKIKECVYVIFVLFDYRKNVYKFYENSGFIDSV